MKCRICGYNARDIAGMARHYRRKHPVALKRGRMVKKHKGHKWRVTDRKLVPGDYARYCPHCGEKL